MPKPHKVWSRTSILHSFKYLFSAYYLQREKGYFTLEKPGGHHFDQEINSHHQWWDKLTSCASSQHTEEVGASLLQCSCQKCRTWILSGGKSRQTQEEGHSTKQLPWTLHNVKVMKEKKAEEMIWETQGMWQVNGMCDPHLVKGTQECLVLFL